IVKANDPVQHKIVAGFGLPGNIAIDFSVERKQLVTLQKVQIALPKSRRHQGRGEIEVDIGKLRTAGPGLQAPYPGMAGKLIDSHADEDLAVLSGQPDLS